MLTLEEIDWVELHMKLYSLYNLYMIMQELPNNQQHLSLMMLLDAMIEYALY
jgi:hypothetical protein